MDKYCLIMLETEYKQYGDDIEVVVHTQHVNETTFVTNINI